MYCEAHLVILYAAASLAHLFVGSLAYLLGLGDEGVAGGRRRNQGVSLNQAQAVHVQHTKANLGIRSHNRPFYRFIQGLK